MYWDKQLHDLIKYGFPLDFDRKNILQSTHDNHASAIQHVDQIDRYLNEELKYGLYLMPLHVISVLSNILSVSLHLGSLWGMYRIITCTI